MQAFYQEFGSAVFGNVATQQGGGMYLLGSQVVLTNVTLSENQAFSGGAVAIGYSTGQSPQLCSCTIRNNSAVVGGGLSLAMIARSGRSSGDGNVAFSFVDVALEGNQAQGGAGIYIDQLQSSTPTFVSCRLIGNAASEMGGGILFGQYSEPVRFLLQAAS